MKRIVAGLLLGFLLAAGAAIWLWAGLHHTREQVGTLEKTLEFTQSELLGHTAYRVYLGAGKQSLSAQMRLIAAKIIREESAIQVEEKSVLGLSSNGVVSISYTAEYVFGYDLRPESYDLRAAAGGIEVRIGRPILAATPAVQDLKYRILSGGMFTDDKAAVIHLYEQAAVRAAEQGRGMTIKPEVMALCEKQLIAFLRDFLAKQPGVKFVPQITVVYK